MDRRTFLGAAAAPVLASTIDSAGKSLQETSKPQTSSPRTEIPALALILHYPWINPYGVDKEFIGPIAQTSSLRACNRFNQFDKDLAQRTPEVTDCFLRYSAEPVLVSNQALGGDPSSHRHDILHEDQDVFSGLSSGQNIADANNSGGSQHAPPAAHKHRVTLRKPSRNVFLHSGTDLGEVIIDDEYHEPEHFEVNAYHAKDRLPEIPIGTLVFFASEYQSADLQEIRDRNWIILNDERMPLSDILPSQENDWSNILLKVVDCAPELGRQGTLSHTHSCINHKHEVDSGISGRVGNIDGGSFSNVNAAARDHTHSNVVCSDLGLNYVEPARNLPLSRSVILAIAQDNAEWYPGMLLPYVPYSEDDYRDLPPSWEQHAEPDLDKKYLYGAKQMSGYMQDVGEEQHSHYYQHSHTVTLSGNGSYPYPTTGDGSFKKGVILIAESKHSHSVKIIEEGDSEPAENVIRHRMTSFITYVGQ